MVLAVGLKQLGVYLLLMAAFIGYATWRFWPDMGPSAPGFDQHE